MGCHWVTSTSNATAQHAVTVKLSETPTPLDASFSTIPPWRPTWQQITKAQPGSNVRGIQIWPYIVARKWSQISHVYIFYHIFTCKICNVIACWDFSFSTWGAGVGTYSWYVILVKSGASCRLLRRVRSLLLRLNVGSCHRNCSGMPWRKFRNKSEWFQQSWWQNRCGLRVIDACLT